MRQNFLVGLASGLFFLVMAGTASADLLTNGDFETGDFSGWTKTGDISIETWLNGNDVARFVNNSNSGVSDTVLRQAFYLDPTLSGVNVSFDFRFGSGEASNVDFYNSFLQIETTTPVDFFKAPIITQRDNMTGRETVSTYISFGGLNIEDIDPNASIVFSITDYPCDWSWANLDNVSVDPVNPVPEPATVLLFGAGLVGLAGTRLRKKKK